MMNFTFKNTSDYTLLDQESNGLQVNISRYVRRHKIPNTKQPVPFGAILGSEIKLVATDCGLKASGYKFKLFLDGTCIQSENLNESGEFVGLLVNRKDAIYRIRISRD